MTDEVAQPFQRIVKLGRIVAQSDWWMLLEAQTPHGAGQAAIERDAYLSLVNCAWAEATSEDAHDNALLEIEVVLETKYRQDPKRALAVFSADVEQAVARYVN